MAPSLLPIVSIILHALHSSRVSFKEIIRCKAGEDLPACPGPTPA